LFFGQAEVADPTLAGLDTPERRQAFMASPQDLETSQGINPWLREDVFCQPALWAWLTYISYPKVSL